MTDRRTLLKLALTPLLALRRARAATIHSLYLQDVSVDRATLVWTTAEPGQGTVTYWGVDGAIRQAFAQARYLPGIGWQHRASLSDLEPATEYSSRLEHAGEDLVELPVRTPRPGKFKFIVFGDSGTGSDEQLALTRQMQTENPDLVLHTGDVVYPAGSLENYRLRYLDSYATLMRSVPFYPCPGNHDYAEDGGEAYRMIHSLPSSGVLEYERGRYYSFDRGDVHFVSLDSNECSDAMLQWLERDLSTTDRRWRIAYFHHPPYSLGPHRDDPLAAITRDRVVPILERGGVRVVLNGHDHNYQRTHPLRAGELADGGIVYVTTGGGGAGLYDLASSEILAFGAVSSHYVRVEASNESLRLEAIAIDAQVLDSVTLE
jgi:predicted phosphodiesterase